MRWLGRALRIRQSIGWGAVLVAIPAAGIGFAYLGFRNAVEYAGESDNPKKNIPFAVIGSIVLTIGIYVILQFAFITAVLERYRIGMRSHIAR